MRMAARLVPGWLLFLGLVASPALEAQVADSMQACNASHWSAPRLLEERREDAFEVMEASIAANSRGEILIAGRGPAVYEDSGWVVAFPFAAYRIDARGERIRLPSPAYAGAYAYPRLAIINDTVHMFWGGPDSTAVFEAGPEHRHILLPPIKSIWTASYVDGWSEPKFLGRLNAGTVLFSLRYSSRGTSSSSLHTPLSEQDKIRWLALDGWVTIPHLRFARFGYYPRIIYPGPSEIVVGYVADDDGYSVHVVRSSDNGQSWSERARIAPGYAKDVTLVVTRNGLLHAVWTENTKDPKSLANGRIGHAVSSDTGRSWTAPAYLVVKQPIWHYRVVADRNDNLHLVFQGIRQDSIPGVGFVAVSGLYYTARSADGDWSGPAVLFGEKTLAREPELTVTSTGELAMLFGQYLGMRGDHPWYASAVSFLRPGKDCVVRP